MLDACCTEWLIAIHFGCRRSVAYRSWAHQCVLPDLHTAVYSQVMLPSRRSSDKKTHRLFFATLLLVCWLHFVVLQASAPGGQPPLQLL